jgi:hypothetical protein
MRLLFRLIIITMFGFSQTINEQLKELETATPSRRVELMNSIKKQLILMNQQDRMQTIYKLRAKLQPHNQQQQREIDNSSNHIIIQDTAQNVHSYQEHIKDIVVHNQQTQTEPITQPNVEHNQPTQTQPITQPNVEHNQPTQTQPITQPNIEHNQPTQTQPITQPNIEHNQPTQTQPITQPNVESNQPTQQEPPPTQNTQQREVVNQDNSQSEQPMNQLNNGRGR